VVQQAYVSATIWPDLPAIAKQGLAGAFRSGNQRGFLEQGQRSTKEHFEERRILLTGKSEPATNKTTILAERLNQMI
jgi:hypothetical protein